MSSNQISMAWKNMTYLEFHVNPKKNNKQFSTDSL